MSTFFLPVIDHLAAAGVVTAAHAQLRGSPVIVIVAVAPHAERAHEVSADRVAAASRP